MNARQAKSRSVGWMKRRSSTSPVKQMPRRTLMVHVVLSMRVASIFGQIAPSTFGIFDRPIFCRSKRVTSSSTGTPFTSACIRVHFRLCSRMPLHSHTRRSLKQIHNSFEFNKSISSHIPSTLVLTLRSYRLGPILTVYSTTASLNETHREAP